MKIMEATLSLILILILVLGNTQITDAKEMKVSETIAAGGRIAFDRSKGNCLACHKIKGGELAGDSGPPLIYMQLRYPDKLKLRAQIWDATAKNPLTAMPPFGRHGILTEQEIDKVVDFIHSL